MSAGLLLSEGSPGFAPRGKDFSAPQPADLGDLACRGRDRGRRAVGLVDHRAICRRAGDEVFAVAGSPLDALSAGTNNLLKQGESLVT